MNSHPYKGWGATVQYAVRTAIAWFFRKRGPEKYIFTGGIVLLTTISGANAYLKYEGPLGTIEVGSTGAIPDLWFWSIACLGILLVVWSFVMAWHRYRDEQHRLSRKKVLVIEARGLRDDSGAPLVEAVPVEIEGFRTSYVLDVRQRKDGVIVDPEDLLPPVQSMKVWLHQIQKVSDRADLTVVYGGLTAVPLTFLSGVLLDDEGSIVVMDWDRSLEAWRTLNDPDDKVRFAVDGIDAFQDAQEVVLAVSVSYQVKSEDLATTFAIPVVSMTLTDLTSSHWSQAKQSALADQMFDVLKRLDARGVQQVHLVLAAQNSVAFNFGRRYDKRNLPRISVYQFERAQECRYPWAIQMPVSGVPDPVIIRPAN